MINIEFKNGHVLEVKEPIKVKDIIDSSDYNYFACKVNNKLKDFEYVIKTNCCIDFLDCKDNDACRVYESSLRFVFLMAAYRVDKNMKLEANYDMSRSISFIRVDGEEISKETFDKIKEEMENIIKSDYAIKFARYSKEEAIRIYSELGHLDKIDSLKYRPEKDVHMFVCEEYRDYMYSYPIPSSGYLTKYRLEYYDGAIYLVAPRSELEGEVPDFVVEKTYGDTLKKVRKLSKVNGTSTVREINEHLLMEDPLNFILTCENKHDLMFEEVANKIVSNENIAIIAIAGPSSSGKTTFSNRLKVKLMEKGLKPVVISMDDYYYDRTKMDLNKITDFEDIKLLDLDLFNQNMKDLIDGKEVTLPRFDFPTKKRVVGKTLKLEGKSPILVEGIHALNELTTKSIEKSRKFKIYIGPHLQTNIDNHNPISVTHLRLIRRLVRDYKFRNASADTTLRMWDSVRNGEFKWIYVNQDGVDYVFNSELDYELCVLKKHILPLIDKVNSDSIYYNLAKTLKKYVKYFKSIEDDLVPSNSLLREFIGGSCFKY